MIFVTRPHLPPLEEYTRYLRGIWERRWLTNHGELVQELEERLKQYLGVEHLALMSNGTLALQLALKALNVSGEVITTPYTFAATTNVIIWEGATPVFADIDPATYNLDSKSVERAITEKTTAIMAVHVYGNPCAVEELQHLADKYHLKLLYDAAHAFGVRYGGQSVLNYGDVSTLSFHATKVYHTIEGGAVIARDKATIDKIKLLGDFGITDEDDVVLPGINSKMNEFQAAMGLANLSSIDAMVEKRCIIYERYRQGLGQVYQGYEAVLQFQKLAADRYNYSYFPVVFPTEVLRERIYDILVAAQIKPRRYFYPITSDFGFFSKTERDANRVRLVHSASIAGRVLCLPIYPELGLDVVDEIIRVIKNSI